jgi:NADPH:quinone reductase-like Zn-dependent oxidoreductase
MRAALLRDYAETNDAVEVTEIPTPEPLPNGIVIEVHASSVNPIDNVIRSGRMKQFMPVRFPLVMGNDVSGIVSAVGGEVTRFKKGYAVFARPNPAHSGTFAEYVSVHEQDAALMPSNLTHAEAAAVPLVGLTAWQGLVDKAKLQKGERVLIHAGSGGVGTMAIQLAKQLGAGEVATTTSAEGVDLVNSLGADVVIDYQKQSFEEVLHDYDVVFDTIGGETQVRSFQVLKNGGRLVAITGRPDARPPAGAPDVHFELFFMKASGAQLEKLADLIAAGKLRPIIDRTFPLEQVKDALNYSQSGRAKGKVIIQVWAD